jgi:MFS family permease
MSANDTENPATAATGTGAFAPLSVPIFRRIWTASLISNFGHLMLGVAAAWEMTRLTDSKEMVALVQSALMLPLMLVSLPAGALADMFDRRRIAMTGLGFSIFSGLILTTLAVSGMLTPWLLLLFCVLIGGGVALYYPAWQASIGEQVGHAQLPAAIALGTISHNIARSIGPALGGLLIVAAGAQAAFAINTLFYIPLLLAFLFWRKVHVPSRLPPERIDRAIVTGARYAMHSPPVRNVFLRTSAFTAAGAATAGLAPLVARDLLSGNAGTFGLLMGAGGVGAVGGAMLVARLRDRISPEQAVRISAVVTAASLATIGFSRSLPLSCFAMAISSAANMQSIAMLNVSVQTAVPRWVTARALSLFSASLTAGIAVGAWFWGWVASHVGLDNAFYGSAAAVALTALLGFLIPLRRADESGAEMISLGNDPDVALALTLRSGPVTIEIDYEIDPDLARGFYNVMRQMQRARLRRGAFNWTLSRDIGHPSRWTERYQCSTWADYLRQRDRYTQSDLDLQIEADAFHSGKSPKTIRRLLERPFGSVRWKAESPDTGQDLQGYLGL